MDTFSSLGGILISGSVLITGLWKLFSLHKEIAVLEIKINQLESEVDKNAQAVLTMETRIVESLRRIEDRLDSLVDKRQ